MIKEKDLNNMRRSEVVKKLIELTGLTEFSLRKTLNNMEKKDLIKIENGNLRLTELGEILADL